MDISRTPVGQRHTFDSLKEYVEAVFKKYLSTTEAGTETEREKERLRKEVLRDSMSCCFAGTIKERNFVKQFIARIITGQVKVFIEDVGEKFRPIDSDTIKEVFNWDNPYRLPTQVKFLGLLYFWQGQYGADSFEHIVSRYNLSAIREIRTIQGDSKTTKAIYIDDKDITTAFVADNVKFNYDLALDVLVQMLYEETKGNGCIDELLYQNVDDIGIGLSGLQDDVEPLHLRNKKISKAYKGAWIKYKGLLMHVTFLSFHNFGNLRRVVNQLVAYEQQGSFSEKDGYKMGYGKDGSRRTSVISPFAENCAAWVRKFTAKNKTNKQLITASGENEIPGYEKLIAVEKALVMGGATIPICGPQGAGKTTKLEAISEYIQNWYAIRMIESEFEARIRWRYPEKNILTVQTTNISPEHAYEFSLRTSGDIYIVSEVRSDEMMVNITRTANRGGRSVLFTYHPNKPRATIIEIANSLIRQKLYTSLKDAMYTTLEAVKCCIHLEIDLTKKCRYYNIYEFLPVKTKIADEFKSLSGKERDEAFHNTMYSFYTKMMEDDYFEVVPIIVYDRDTDSYVFKNTLSDRFYEELMRQSYLDDEKENLEKLFRPEEWINKYLKRTSKSQVISRDLIEDIIKKEGLNENFVNIDSVIENYEECGAV